MFWTKDKEEEESDRFRVLHDTFCTVDASLRNYSSTCAAFVEMTGLFQEGLDQVTGDVLSFCSSVPENSEVVRLESKALVLRDSVPCEQVVNESIRNHLLMPLGQRLENFQDLKNRVKLLKSKKRTYADQRKRMGKLRVDRRTDHAKLVMEEESLVSKRQEYEDLNRKVENDLEYIFANRAQILRDPFEALLLCQRDFMLHMCEVMTVSEKEEKKQVVSGRQRVAQIVKDYHAIKGKAIFERPPQFKQVFSNVQYQSSDLSTYMRVRLFVQSVILSQQVELLLHPDPLIHAVLRIQNFFRVLEAQKAARILASQILAVHTDPTCGQQFWSNPHTGLLSWYPPIFFSKNEN